MRSLPDYHLHTFATEDGNNSVLEIAEAAASRGLEEIVITDHYIEVDDNYKVTLEVLNKHRADAKEAFERFGIKVLVGSEVDYMPDYVSEIKAFINSFDFDFVMGSAHFVGRLPIANEDVARKFIKDNGPVKAFKKALESAERAADSGLFDVIAHLDIIRKFYDDPEGPLPFGKYSDAAESLAKALKNSGTGFEVNCRGFGHAAGSQYPSDEFLTVLKRYEIDPITIGSDAHKTEFIGKDLDKGLKALSGAGFSELTLYDKRKPCRVPFDNFNVG